MFYILHPYSTINSKELILFIYYIWIERTISWCKGKIKEIHLSTIYNSNNSIRIKRNLQIRLLLRLLLSIYYKLICIVFCLIGQNFFEKTSLRLNSWGPRISLGIQNYLFLQAIWHFYLILIKLFKSRPNAKVLVSHTATTLVH